MGCRVAKACDEPVGSSPTVAGECSLACCHRRDLLLNGRKLWETMSSYWPTGDKQPDATPAKIEFARNWRDTPKVVFSSTIDQVVNHPFRVRCAVGGAYSTVRPVEFGALRCVHEACTCTHPIGTLAGE